ALCAAEKTVREAHRACAAASRQLLEQANVETPEALDQRLADLEANRADLDARRSEATAEGLAARTSLAQAQAAAARLAELEKAHTVQEDLLAQVPRVEARRTELERAQRAEAIQAIRDRLTRSEALWAERRGEAERLDQAVQAAGDAVDRAEADLKAEQGREPRREELRRTLDRLAELEPKLQELEQGRIETREVARARREGEETLQASERTTEKTARRFEELQVRRATLQAEADQADGRQHLLYLARSSGASGTSWNATGARPGMPRRPTPGAPKPWKRPSAANRPPGSASSASWTGATKPRPPLWPPPWKKDAPAPSAAAWSTPGPPKATRTSPPRTNSGRPSTAPKPRKSA
ncbi:MAG TPA: hypothetical protein PKO12_05815, partial [Holophaga sp.]|nr:hypothetical protein [Holophaga sp.]